MHRNNQHPPRAPLAVPGRVNFSISQHQGHLAHPVSFTLMAPGQVDLHSFGGITKVELMAATIAGALMGTNPHVDASSVVRIAVAMARDIQRVAAEKPPESQEGPTDEPKQAAPTGLPDNSNPETEGAG